MSSEDAPELKAELPGLPDVIGDVMLHSACAWNRHVPRSIGVILHRFPNPLLTEECY
jgi:hypothetical protein